jgi:hypothetical protein
MLVASSFANVFKQVRLQAAKVLGIYLSPSEGDIKYTASVAFRFGFEYSSTAKVAKRVTTSRFRSAPTTLSAYDVKMMLKQNDFFCASFDWTKEWSNPNGKGIENDFELQQDGKVVFDGTTGLMWQQGGSSNYMKFADAHNYIRQLNSQRFAGYSDWRLPTLEEAMSLMEPEKKNGDLYIDPVFDKTQWYIWTADKVTAGVAWVVGFSYGGCNPNALDLNDYVRAVR